MTGPPLRAYGQPAKDWATSSVPGAAAIRCSVPSVRSRLVVWKALSMSFMSMPDSAVIWWTITSGRVASTAARTEVLSSPSMIWAFAPSARSSPVLVSLRVVPVTLWPLEISTGMSARPAAPVAPAIRMCMVSLTRRHDTL